jgi:hypothetical protein
MDKNVPKMQRNILTLPPLQSPIEFRLRITTEDNNESRELIEKKKEEDLRKQEEDRHKTVSEYVNNLITSVIKSEPTTPEKAPEPEFQPGEISLKANINGTDAKTTESPVVSHVSAPEQHGEITFNASITGNNIHADTPPPPPVVEASPALSVSPPPPPPPPPPKSTVSLEIDIAGVPSEEEKQPEEEHDGSVIATPSDDDKSVNSINLEFPTESMGNDNNNNSIDGENESVHPTGISLNASIRDSLSPGTALEPLQDSSVSLKSAIEGKQNVLPEEELPADNNPLLEIESHPDDNASALSSNNEEEETDYSVVYDYDFEDEDDNESMPAPEQGPALGISLNASIGDSTSSLPGTALPGTALPGTALPGTALPAPAPQRDIEVPASVRSIGLTGTVYFYVNQNTKTPPILMSGKINHSFDVTDTNTPISADIPIQITHTITDASVATATAANKPFNGSVTLDNGRGNFSIGIGDNVYILSNIAHRTIQVSEITPISTLSLPNNTFRTGSAYKPFVQKYFEYSGKIYVDDWSSQIHWYTFYNPENYMVPRDPTKEDAQTGGFDIGNWALYQRRIYISIGEINVTSGNITITPPPFSIDMQKTSVEGGGGGAPTFGKPKTPDKSKTSRKKQVDKISVKPTRSMSESNINNKKKTLETPPKDNVKDESIDAVNELHQLLNNIYNESGKGELFEQFIKQIVQITATKINNNELLNEDDIINALKNTYSSNPQLLDKIKQSQITEFLVEAINKTFFNKDIKSNNSLSPRVTYLRKPNVPVSGDIAFRIQISGTLETEKGTYNIHHTFYLSRDNNTTPATYPTYTISNVKNDHPKQKDEKKEEPKLLYIEGNFKYITEPLNNNNFIVNINTPLEVEEISFTSKSNQKPTKKEKGKEPFTPILIINRIHIYSGNEKPVTNKSTTDEPIYFVYFKSNKTPEPIPLPNTFSSAESIDPSIICDFKSTIHMSVMDHNKTNRTQSVYLNGTVGEYTMKDKTASAVKPGIQSQRRKSSTFGGQKTRRVRDNIPK